MSQCSLSTDYLKQIGKQPDLSQLKSKASNSYDPTFTHHFYRKSNEYYYSKDLFDEMENDYFKSEAEANPTDWLISNYLTALKKLEASRPIQTELIRLRHELIDELKLVDLSWNCDWAVSHIRGCLKNLSILSKQYPSDFRKLKGKKMIFSRNSGIGLNGQIVLNIEDVRNSWLDLIRSIKDYDCFVAAVPEEEKKLSGMLYLFYILQIE